MILVDTSVWADHFRKRLPAVTLLFAGGELLQHPFVTGELMMGNPADRKAMSDALESLRQAAIVEHAEFLEFVEQKRLFGTGLGIVDAHLLASADAGRHLLWSTDKRLAQHAQQLGLAYSAE